MAAKNIIRIQHQNKSDPSSSDDGMPQPVMQHRVAAGLSMAHNKMIAHAGTLSETIEMQSLTSCEAHHRTVEQEDSVQTNSTFSPKTFSSGRDTIETNLSVTTRGDTFEKDDCIYKRSRSYHGKGSVHSCVSRCCNTRCNENMMSLVVPLLSMK